MKKYISFITVFALVVAALGTRAVMAQVDDLAAEITAFTTPTQNGTASEVVSIAATGDVMIVGTVVEVATSTVPQLETPVTEQTPSATSDVQQGKVYVAELDGVQEVPSNNSPATGSAVLVFTGSNTAILNASFTGLTSPETAAHIHGPGEIGVNAPAIIPLPNGQITNHSITFTDAQLAQIDIGMLYINIHSEQYPEGEIRGQLLLDMEASQRVVFGSPMNITVNAWGMDWQVEATNDTALISGFNMPTTATSSENASPMAGDQIAVIGMVATSTSQTPTSGATSTAPTVTAFSIMQLSSQETTDTNETTTSTESFGDSFMDDGF